MDEDLLDLISTAKAIHVASESAHDHWPPSARELAALCLGLANQVARVAKLIEDQDAVIVTLREAFEKVDRELTAIKKSLDTDHVN